MRSPVCVLFVTACREFCLSCNTDVYKCDLGMCEERYGVNVKDGSCTGESSVQSLFLAAKSRNIHEYSSSVVDEKSFTIDQFRNKARRWFIIFMTDKKNDSVHELEKDPSWTDFSFAGLLIAV